MAAELTPEDKALLDKQLKWFTESAEPEHKQHEKDWDRQDTLYFGHKRFVQQHATQATPKGRDGVLRDARKEFGDELHIPYVWATMETVMPRALSNRPKMLWTPRDRVAESNVENVTVVCDAQQERADYELKLQTTFRSAFKHGLGVQKTYWRLDTRDTMALRQSPETGEWVAAPTQQTAWDDPDCEDVDIHDFYWDRLGDSMRNVPQVMHRTWRDTAYCLAKIDSGAWSNMQLAGVIAEDLTGSTGKAKYDEAWAARRRAMGFPISSPDRDVHEVWEIHVRNTNDKIIIVDRMWVGVVERNPYWHGEMPFQTFCPIEVEHRFCGLGIIDPIEDLQRELNWLRTDRRWNAMLKLHQAYAYNDGLIDPSAIKIGPGRLVPVNGDPKDLLVPLTVGDIPNSGYQEEAAIRGDIELASGLSESMSGVSSAGETATGVQLVQAAAGLRIQALTNRGVLQLIKPQARQWLALNQQRWTTERDVAFPAVPEPGAAQRFWSLRKVGPAQMQGEFEVKPDGGSMAPENVPQKRNDAMLILQLLSSPAGMQLMDASESLRFILEKIDVPTPELFLQSPSAIPAETLDVIKNTLVAQAGMDPSGAHALIATALQQTMAMKQEAAQQGARAGGQGGAPSGQQTPPQLQNGAGPAPAPTQA
jgi:hypothetical protein